MTDEELDRDRPVIEMIREVEALLVRWDQEGGDNSIRLRARLISEIFLGHEAVVEATQMKGDIAH